MKPTIGRIVLFHYERSSNRGMRTRPAIITNVDPNGVDLEVFGDITGEDGLGKFQSDVKFCDLSTGNVAAGPQTWTWPPREETRVAAAVPPKTEPKSKPATAPAAEAEQPTAPAPAS